MDVVVNGVRLERQRLGPPPGSAPTLVFLHDGLGCVATWRDVPAALVEMTGWSAIIYSRQGYGGSGVKPGPWPDHFMHDEALTSLPALLAAEGLDDVALFGHSDGASIAILAAGSGAWPTDVRLRGLVLEAPHTFVEPVCVESIEQVRQSYRESGFAARMERVHGAQADDCFAHWTEVWLRPSFRDWNILDAARAIPCPVLVVQGREDPFGTLAQVGAIVDATGGEAASLVLDECGHTPHHQRRDRALPACAAFIAGLR